MRECDPFWPAGTHGTVLSLVREPKSLWAPVVLHAACVGVEGESSGRLRQLAPKRFLRILCGQRSRVRATAGTRMTAPPKQRWIKPATKKKPNEHFANFPSGYNQAECLPRSIRDRSGSVSPCRHGRDRGAV